MLNLAVADDQSTNSNAAIDGFRRLTQQEDVVAVGGIIGSNIALATARLAEEAHRDPGPAHARQRLVERQQQPGAVARDAVGGPGAAVRDGRIEIQGEHRDRLVEALRQRGFDAKRSGG